MMIIKEEIIQLVMRKLSKERIVVGGNKVFYKKRYNLRITKKIIKKVINAFWDVIVDIIKAGDGAQIHGYITIEPKNCTGYKMINRASGEIIHLPAHYRVFIRQGERLKNACKELNERELEKISDDSLSDLSPIWCPQKEQ